MILSHGMSRKFSKIFLIVMAVVIMITFLLGTFARLPNTQNTSQQVQVPASQLQTKTIPAPEVLGASASQTLSEPAIVPTP
jgi:cytochrome oxidase assembly protein ShyY1